MEPRRKITIRPSSAGQPAAAPKRSASKLGMILMYTLPGLLFGVLIGFLLNRSPRPVPTPTSSIISQDSLTAPEGRRVFSVLKDDLELRQFLTKLSVPENMVRQVLADPAIQSFKKLSSGSSYEVHYPATPPYTPSLVIYEAADDKLAYLYFAPYARVEMKDRKLSTVYRQVAGVVRQSFWQEILEDNRLHHSLIPLSEQALKWSVDLFHLQPGDQFKLLFSERKIGDQTIGVEELTAIYIQSRGGSFYAFSYPAGDTTLYLDQFGYRMERRFLKAPVKFGIISSPYNPRRLHPVDNVIRGHFGTDYAAPSGAPIYAMADGTVSEARNRGANGNYVKIRHDEVYETQYLHMKDFAPNVRPGVRVRQGDVIGYVGQTGKATGPHVCFRFWVNGEQLDFSQHKDNGASTLPEAVDPIRFASFRDSITTIFDSLTPEPTLQ